MLKNKKVSSTPIGELVGELGLDVKVPEDTYSILKAYIDSSEFYVSSIETVKDTLKLRIILNCIEVFEECDEKSGEKKIIRTPFGGLLFDITIPERKYNIIKAFEDRRIFNVSNITLTKNSKLHISLAFGVIKMGKVVVSGSFFRSLTGLVVNEE